jgi:RecA/RadA recombinase
MAEKTEKPKKKVEAAEAPTARERTVAILAELQSQEEFEDLTVMDATRISNVPTQSSGVLTLDVLLGGGPPPGIPQGRIIEVFGSEGSGKTTLTLHMIAEAQRSGKVCAFIDVEHALDPTYAQRIGVDFSTLLFRQPDSGEQALNTVEALVGKMQCGDLVVVDSVASLTPQAELDGEMGDSHMGLQARLMSQAMRKLNGAASSRGVTVIFINQIRCLPLETMICRNSRLCLLRNVVVGDYLADAKGAITEVRAIHDAGVVSGKRIEAHQCPPFCLSDAHLQPILADNLFYKKGKDIVKGDWIIQPVLSACVSESREYASLESLIAGVEGTLYPNVKEVDLPRVLDEDLAFFLGCCYSDGNLYSDLDNSDYRIQFTERDEHRYQLVSAVAIKLFGAEACYTNKETGVVRVGGKRVFSYLSSLGCKSYGKEKTLPPVILGSPASVVRAFIRGAFFDTHHFDDFGFISTHENIEAAYEFSKVLYYFGIFADVRGGYLYITGEDAIRFREIIGFAEETKQVKAASFVADRGARGKYDVVPLEFCQTIFAGMKSRRVRGISKLPYYNAFKMCLFKKLNASRRRLIEMLNATCDPEMCQFADFLSQNRFSQVIGVEDAEFPAMDVETVSGSFIADRFLTHNSKIGVVFGNPETTTGGNALKFYASQRIEVKTHGEKPKDKEGNVLGQRVHLHVVKNKIAPPFRKGEVILYYGLGFPRHLEIFHMAVSLQIITKAGSSYSYKEERLGVGMDKSVEAFVLRTDLQDKLEAEILQRYGYTR